MTADRDRLAADLTALLTERGAVFYGAVPTEGTDETIIADSLIALGWTRLDEEQTTFAWLIERGQPEGLDAPEWWGITEPRTAAFGWTRDAWQAARYSSEVNAKLAIARFDLPGHPFGARAVEHGFGPRPVMLDEERLARALVDHCHDSADEGPPIYLRHRHLAPLIVASCPAAIARAMGRT